MQNKLLDQGKELFKLKKRKEKLESDLKQINKDIDSLQIKLAEDMDAAECSGFKVAGMGTIYPSIETYVSVLKDDRPKLYKYLRDTNNEAMIVDWVFPQTLTAFVKEQAEKGRTMPDFVKVTRQEIAKTRKG